MLEKEKFCFAFLLFTFDVQTREKKERQNIITHKRKELSFFNI